MGSLTLLLLGMSIVVAGIVGLRWHPFVALVAAGLSVAALTPAELLYRSQLDAPKRAALLDEAGGIPEAAPPELARAHETALAHSRKWFVARFTEAFGRGCEQIALIIAMAAIIGRCLLDSGGAKRIVDALMRLCGARGAPFAFAGSAFTLGIPVFFETVFYLLLPLGKAMRRETGRDYLLYLLTIVAGATMAHSLVPPTPGPLAVAEAFGDRVSVGSMMLGGLVVGLFTVAVGIAYAYWANRRWEIPLREEEGDSAEGAPLPGNEPGVAPPLPALWLSLLPIVLPVALIGGNTILAALGNELAAMKLLGDKNIALLVSAAAAAVLLRLSPTAPKGGAKAAVSGALASAGVIILITSAGSAFGSVLKDANVAEFISDSIEGRQTIMLIPVAYLMTALIRTAQGSATVAMITAGGMVAPLAAGADLSYSALYLALAIGCGSKPISWANDSGFWVIGRMTGMTPMETFKTVSVMMLLMSLAGLALILVGAVVLPLA
jgi:GntP family gluconate:H+ symporter